MSEYPCPNCGAKLETKGGSGTVWWQCSSCNGRAIGLGVLRHLIEKKYLDKLWLLARERHSGARKCAFCETAMVRVELPPEAGDFELDVCLADFYVWFDAEEFEKAPALPPPLKTEPELPVKAKQAFAIAQAEAMFEKVRAQHQMENDFGEWAGIIMAVIRVLTAL